jgi:putative transposase
MARPVRVVEPGRPHHVIQRGNRRQRVFFRDDDYREYRGLVAHWCSFYGVEVWCYCLMPNHVHLLAVPCSADALSRAFGQAHRRYTRMINSRHGWTGHLWQGRFTSALVDNDSLLATARYIELNPVRARLAARPEDYAWSSAGTHVDGRPDCLARGGPFAGLLPQWREFLEGLRDRGPVARQRAPGQGHRSSPVIEQEVP